MNRIVGHGSSLSIHSSIILIIDTINDLKNYSTQISKDEQYLLCQCWKGLDCIESMLVAWFAVTMSTNHENE